MTILPTLIIILPLCAALLSVPFSAVHEKLGRNIILCTLCAALVLAVMQLREVILNGPISFVFGNYAVPYGIEFSVDVISALVVLMVQLLGFLSCIFATSFEPGNNRKLLSGGGFAMHALLVMGMSGMTMTGDVFNLYVFLEVTSLSAYILIAAGGSRGVVSAFRYLLVGTVAATFYLLGVGILYANTGTLNMADMKAILDKGGYDNVMLVVTVLFIAAFGIKMALFPFHGWQPSAYAHANNAERPIIAGAMGKIPALALFRYTFCIFGTDFVYLRPMLMLLGVLSCAGMLYGSIRALHQTDIRHILAYSSVAQIGYIALGFAIGTPLALTGSFLHMLGHAFMKGGLFFVTAAISYKYHSYKLEDFGRIYKTMPLTGALLVTGALSMIGIPPTVGFFSKWYLALGAATATDYVYIAILVLSSLLNAIYFFKLIEKVFIQEAKAGTAGPSPDVKKSALELPLTMVVPIVTCILVIVLLGVFNVYVADILQPVLEEVAL